MKVPYDFFFSYPRAVESEFLRRFFVDLNDELRLQRGLPKGTQVGFFDRIELETGVDWPDDIKDALQTSKTFVPIYSPAYFKGTFCELEMKIFLRRRQAYLARYAPGSVLPPPVIKPVPWINGFKVPDAYQHIQYSTGTVVEEEGLLHAKRTQRSNNKQYREYIERLATAIKDVADAVEMPALVDFPPLSEQELPAAVEVGTDDEGTDYVRFVYAAATDGEVRALRSKLDYYGARSHKWKPFLPDEARTIGLLSQLIAAEQGFSSTELPFAASLPDQIALAEGRGNLVIILVDAWAVRLQAYQSILGQLDRRAYLNCCIIVPWNVADDETKAARDLLTNTIRTTMRRWTRDPNPLRFNDAVNDATEFRCRLGDALTRLQAEILNTSPAPSFPPQARPVLNNSLGSGK